MRNGLLLSLLLFAVMPLYAGVNLKNGNFYISYTDVIAPGGGEDLEITRTYNSKAIQNGWWGTGWGSDFETYLTISPDGTVTVYENGTGASTRFTPKEAVDPKVGAEKIVEEMKKKSPIDGKLAADLVKKLANDVELREAYSRKFGVSAKLATGTVLYATSRGLQQITKTATGYKRSYNDGKIDLFNDDGKLIKVISKNNYTVDITYAEGVVQSVKDSQGKQLFFSWYPDKHVKSVWSQGDKKSLYEFQGSNLSKSVDIGGNSFEYTYDNNHNLTGVKYSDGTSMKIAYTPKTQFVSEIITKDGEKTKYIYGADPKAPEFHYWTEVSRLSSSGKETKDKYEYEIKTTKDGERYTSRIATTVNGVTTDTAYNDRGLPEKIIKGTAVTTFAYDTDGLLTAKKSTLGEDIKLEYNKKFKKISRVVSKDGWTNFEYNDKGDLSKADNQTGKSVLLTYDHRGQIAKMVDSEKAGTKKVLTFKYNAFGKPIEIEMENAGSIAVEYDTYGEIKKVDSKQGHKMALQVTQSFQSLLSIVRPAGVSLGL